MENKLSKLFNRATKFLHGEKNNQEEIPHHSSSSSSSSPACKSNSQQNYWEIPFGGNAFITSNPSNGPEIITDHGLANWMNSESICSLMFHLHHHHKNEAQNSNPQQVTLNVTFDFELKLYVANHGQSVIQISLHQNQDDQNDQQYYIVQLNGSEPHVVPVGSFKLKLCPNQSQYHVRLDLQGLENTNGFYADVSDGIVSNLQIQPESISKISSNVVDSTDNTNHDKNKFGTLDLSFVDSSFSYHFGRRGPSVHLNYCFPSNCPSQNSIEYFYNECLVPTGQDIIGSYYCAIGFGGGYFGLQVNSKTERRILFSIWSAFETDCPDSIPNEYKVQLLRKGSDQVHVQPFGCEGSGQQSFLHYNWTTNVKYQFLIYGSPAKNKSDATIFTAWFKPSTSLQWQLIASFLKPKSSGTYLNSLYSFSENFEPNHGYLCRKVYFSNSWAIDSNRVWWPMNQIKFTGDDTSKSCRKDYSAGVENGAFYLRNCGFICDHVNTDQFFINDLANYVKPELNFDTLP